MRVSSNQFFTCMTALSKRSRYSFKGSFSPCLILNKYEPSVPLSSGASQSQAECLAESGFVHVLDEHMCLIVLQVLTSICRAIVRCYGRHLESSWVGHCHDYMAEGWIDCIGLLQSVSLAQ
ncbi:hypothetical protein TIFTF001_034342 [Ficus carica]|uniref:Uncharacterized protein n=1 Tax=Ficus carica TaxID=3494 RepID=A0AA88E3J1_FICCA|nr:hypothetical protein TIFTF001_034342 [Ficus carica]